MMHLPFQFRPGRLVVFEGMDGTGKSTQMKRFQRACEDPELGVPLYEPCPEFTHQPSGASGLGKSIYDLTEEVNWNHRSPFTRQLLHLAAHNEHYINDLIPALDTASVFMDRCWWSAVAYGYRDEVRDHFDWDEWQRVCRVPTQGVMPSVVFLFMSRYAKKDKKAKSDKAVRENYYRLAAQYPDVVEIVPDHNVGEVTAFISGALHRRGLVKECV